MQWNQNKNVIREKKNGHKNEIDIMEMKTESGFLFTRLYLCFSSIVILREKKMHCFGNGIVSSFIVHV